MDFKTKVIHMTITPSQHAKIKAKAKVSGVSMKQYIMTKCGVI